MYLSGVSGLLERECSLSLFSPGLCFGVLICLSRIQKYESVFFLLLLI